MTNKMSEMNPASILAIPRFAAEDFLQAVNTQPYNTVHDDVTSNIS